MKILTSLIALTVLASASYEKAQEFYEQGKYKEAIKEARESTTEYSNSKLHLVWAKSAYALGERNEAMSAYERVVILDESSIESRVALLKIYKESGRESFAKELSGELKNYQLTPEQRSSLELIKSDDIHAIKSKAILSLGHDTNINISAQADDLDAYYGTNSNEGEKSTLFTRVNGSVSYVNELDEKGGWYIRGDIKAYYQNNFDASYFNMLVGSVDAGFGYAKSGYSLYLPFGYDRVNYLDRDLLGQIRVTPRVNITLNKDLILNINAKYASRRYQDIKYKGMDDTLYGGGIGLYYLFDKNFAYLNLMYEDFRSSQKEKYYFIDKSMMTLSLGANYNVKDWFVLRADYRYRGGSYDDSSDLLNSNNRDKRADSYNQVELKISHYFAQNYELFISDRYIKNSSNYIPAEYSKNIFMFGISANY